MDTRKKDVDGCGLFVFWLAFLCAIAILAGYSLLYLTLAIFIPGESLGVKLALEMLWVGGIAIAVFLASAFWSRGSTYSNALRLATRTYILTLISVWLLTIAVYILVH